MNLSLFSLCCFFVHFCTDCHLRFCSRACVKYPVIINPPPYFVKKKASTEACAQAAEDEPPRVDQVPSTGDEQPRSMERDFDYVERPLEDFFCPVSLELLLEPQLTSCCGHHLSLESATRLQREGKACPLCNGEQWSVMLDKYHRRKVHEVRVRCWHTDNGCAWVGEVNDLKRHADACEKRPWECKYCALKCTYGEGEEKHWPACLKFPEPCPNRCEVGSVERCNMEQHRSVCSLEPVACEMKEFGCSVVVPRKELATHMRESELQHLTAMTVLNLRLSRQLQQDSTERDKKIAQLRQEMADLKKLQTEMQVEMKTQLNEQKQLQNEHQRELTELKGHIRKLEHTTHHIEHHTAADGTCSGCEIFTFTQYRKYRGGGNTIVRSDPFYSHYHGYKLQLVLDYLSTHISAIMYLCRIEGEYDDHLHWPVELKAHLELLKQARDHLPNRMIKTENLSWKKDETNIKPLVQIPYSDLEMQGVYVLDDCLKFRIRITVL